MVKPIELHHLGAFGFASLRALCFVEFPLLFVVARL